MNVPLAATETRRLDLQARFDAEHTQAERNRLGQFATPPGLALDIARFVQDLFGPTAAPIRFCDPAVGTGAFYSAFRAAFAKEQVASAMGIEIDPRLARHAAELWAKNGLQVLNADFTQIATNGQNLLRPNLILTNPPYVRHHHLDRTQKVALRQFIETQIGLRVSGLAGLYAYFLILATHWMERGGVAAWLIPSEFMDVNYGEAVRRYLTEFVTPARIHRFDPLDVQFTDALVSSAVVVLRKVRPQDSTLVSFSYGGSLASPSWSQDVSVETLKRTRKWSVFPMRETSRPASEGQVECISADDTRPKFANFFRIQRGIATGYNDLFILTRDEARQQKLPERFLKPILPSPRNLREVVIESEPDGYPKLDPQTVLIDCQLPESVLRETDPALWRYFTEAEKQGARDRYLLSSHKPWYRQEQRSPAPFLCTYMGRGTNDKKPFRFIWNRSRAIATNLYLMLYPIGRLVEQLRVRPALFEDVFAFLNRMTADDLRDAGRVYGGGLHKIEPGELGRVSAQALVARIPELDEAIAEPRLFDRPRRKRPERSASPGRSEARRRTSGGR